MFYTLNDKATKKYPKISDKTICFQGYSVKSCAIKKMVYVNNDI